MLQAFLGFLAAGPLTLWAVALSLSERRKTQPALAVYLSVTAFTWVVLLVGLPAGWFASRTQYTYFYVGSEIIAWGLLSATFVELASMRLSGLDGLRGAADRLVRWFLIICAVGVFGFVFAPESLIGTTPELHTVERSLIQVSLPLGWMLFYYAGKYFDVQPTGRNAAEGWLLAVLYLGCAVLQVWNSFYAWLGICVLSAVCYGAGAVLHFRPQRGSAEPPRPKRQIEPDAAELAIRQARARFDALDQRFDSIGKG